MSSIWGFLSRVYKGFVSPPTVPKAENEPLVRFGLLGAAKIAPPALIIPCRSHPSAVPYAVAARDPDRAQEFAKKWGIEKVYGGSNGYQELLDDKDVDAVYIALPNGLHFEWAARALLAGKHVLLEKPSTNTEEETRKLFKLAKEKNLVLLEAAHNRFHPATVRVKEILASQELGNIKSVDAGFCFAPPILFSSKDIRYDYELGGGAMMDMGFYCIDGIRNITSMEPTSVLKAHQTRAADSALVDRRTIASFALSNSATASIVCDLAVPSILGIIPKSIDVSLKVQCEGGELEFFNYLQPTFYHSITITPRGKPSRVEQVYGGAPGTGVGEDWWSTYRFQLEAFVKKVKGEEVSVWMDEEDSARTLRWIEDVYKTGWMVPRPKSSFVLP